MRQHDVRRSTCVAACLALLACGGSKSSTPVDARAALDRALDRVQAVTARGPGFDLAALQQAVLSDPEMQLIAPPSDGSLWVTAGDNGPLLIVAIDPSPPATVASSFPAPRELSRTTALAVELPGKPGYRLFMGVGGGFGDPTTDLAGMLNRAGYAGSVGSAGIEDLRGVQDTGVLFIKTHGAILKDGTGERYYALYTSTPYPLTPEPANVSDDLLHRRLAIFDAVNQRGWTASNAEERHYAITPDFVAQYMSLAPDGFVMVNACNSSSGTKLRTAFLGKGASLFAGWNNFVAEDGSDTTARYLFDRLLGSNQFRPESPPQRAFDYPPVQTDLAAQGLDHTVTSLGTAALEFFPGGGATTAGLLAPTIEMADVDEEGHKLTLSGVFGTRKGKVSVGGEERAILSWEGQQVVSDLPSAGGPIVVEVDGRKSNGDGSGNFGLALTDWKDIEFDYTFAGPGTLVLKVTWHLHVRAHIQSYREKPHDSPKDRKVDFQVADDSSATFEAAGSYTDPYGGKTTWSGGGSFALVRNATPNAAGFTSYGTIDGKARTMHAVVNAYSPGGWIWTAEGPGGSQTFEDPVLAIPVPNTQPWNFDLQLDDRYGVIAGGPPAFITQSHGISITVAWAWKSAPATEPPADQNAR